MKFGSIPLDEAEGALLAHSLAAGTLRLRKSHRITSDDIVALRAGGVESVVAARLSQTDLDENEAAARLARCVVAPGIEAGPAATGRVNLHAATGGVFVADEALVHAVNRVSPAITIATLPNYTAVEAGRMIATVKIIPFAVDASVVESSVQRAGVSAVLALHPWRPARVALIQTTLAGTKDGVLDKTTVVTARRLARSGSTIAEEMRTPHRADALAQAISEAARKHDGVIIFGASAVSDEDDVLPAAIREAGGIVERVGMPVDPGNLLVLGHLGGKPVIGAPGCARSSRENGFDWVLNRLFAGLVVSPDDIAGMGVGGLLMEIETRPQPREQKKTPGGVHAIVLAAGASSRMGGQNKLLANFGDTRLIRQTVDRVLAAGVDGVTVVVGHQADQMQDALNGADVTLIENPLYAAGLSGSLKAGLAGVPRTAAGALIVLGDMPKVDTGHVDRLIETFMRSHGRAAVRATHDGRRGNPVILPRALFQSASNLTGDTGARALLDGGTVEVIDVEIGEAASIDVDTPEAMRMAGGILPS